MVSSDQRLLPMGRLIHKAHAVSYSPRGEPPSILSRHAYGMPPSHLYDLMERYLKEIDRELSTASGQIQLSKSLC